MSSSTEDDDIIVAEAADICCASCGIAELDDIKLMDCDGCKSVRYCSDECKEDHRPQHEAKCKERASELRDELLFKQPEGTHRGDCPICCLPLPLDPKLSTMYPCCSKLICDGCSYADILRQLQNIQVQSHHQHIQPTASSLKCPFCRHPRPETNEEGDNNLMKRVAANDPVALRQMGTKHFIRKEYDVAFEYLTKAAELGDVDAHFNLSVMYKNGEGVEKDDKKELYHLGEAAIAGHPHARYNLACYEESNGDIDRAVKHFIIAANLGHDDSIQAVKDCYKDELISKEGFAAALRAHHAAVKAMKSPQREAVEKEAKYGRNRN